MLTLIVHAQDLAHPSKRLAIERGLRAGGGRAIDLLQLRCTGDCDDAEARTEALVDAGKRLQALLDENAAQCRAESAHGKPALIVNAPLAIMRGIASPFDGWHVKEKDLRCEGLERLIQNARREQQREKSRKPMLVGCSVHSVASAIFAARLGVDYIQVGTMFPTPSHPEKASWDQIEGPQLLRAIRSESERLGDVTLPPLIGVGGINTVQAVQDVLSAGASGVAVIRGIVAAPNAEAAAAEYRTILDEFRA